MVNGQTLREWFVHNMTLTKTALLNPAVDGFYLDDWWPRADASHGWPPVMTTPNQEWKPPYGNGGAGDLDGTELSDIGLTAHDVDALHATWVSNMKTLVAAILEHGGFAWQLWNGGGGFWRDVSGYNEAVEPPWMLGPQGAECVASLRAACRVDAQQQRDGFHYNFDDMANSTALNLNLAGFLLMRGAFSWFGYGFQGCSKPYYRPPELDVDYGTPIGVCAESKPGVFEREWTRAHVSVDCNTYAAKITPK